MNTLVHVEQPILTVGELRKKIETRSEPVRRSTHVGNQPAHELLLMCAMPQGVEIVMVDTIQGNDSYALPKMVRLPGEGSIPLCKRRDAVGRVVGAISVDAECLPGTLDLACKPIPGESLASFHTRAIEALKPANKPMSMMDFFAGHNSLLSATMAACHELGRLRRQVREDGIVITEDEVDPRRVGIFGIDDNTPSSEGAMLPLNGMMALDMAISASLGSDKTTHLAGPHMVEYTQDRSRMHEVGGVMARVAAELGVPAVQHCYEVVDITGLGRMTVPETHVSQHQLLRSGVQQVLIDDFADMACGSV